MWHKKHRSSDPEAPPGKRLRDNLVDLYASGEVAGERAQSLLDDAGDFARAMGSDELQDLKGKRTQGSSKNQERDLRRRLLRRSKWPPIYVAEVRCYSVKNKQETQQKVAFLLPHEVLGVLSEIGDLETMQQAGALDGHNAQRHQSIVEKLGAPFMSVSLWGDGVPFSWDRKHSADMWAMSFPGLHDKQMRDLRIVITAVPHEVVLRETQDDILSVLAWSFNALAQGAYPDSRHDGAPWLPEDNWRSQRSNQDLLHAAVIEVKGDWKQMCAVFTVPYWMRKPDKPICWRCEATKASLLTESGPAATWLQPEHRLNHFQAMERMLQDGGSVSPAFSIPWLTLDALRIDWLHCADQGVTAVFLGGLFHMFLSDRTYGNNEEDRCARLWASIQDFYNREQTPDRLHNLTVTMVKPKRGAIELSGSGAQVRSLVPFAKEMVDGWAEPLDVEAFTARSCMRHLARCYFFLQHNLQPQADSLLDNALAFHAGLLVLHGLHAKRWQLRPKLHMFLELCSEQGPPSSSWNYREESFGGSVSHQAHRRGGFSTPLGMSRGVLTKFCAKESLPRLLWRLLLRLVSRMVE